MSEDRPLPSVDSVLADLKASGTGAKKLEVVERWIKDNPGESSQTLLLWAEDLHHKDGLEMGEGTLQKIGQAVVGDEYGIRRVGETNSGEIARLRAEVNELRKQLASSSGTATVNAGSNALLRSRVKSLEEETQALRQHNELLLKQAGPQEAAPSKVPEKAQAPPRKSNIGHKEPATV